MTTISSICDLNEQPPIKSAPALQLVYSRQNKGACQCVLYYQGSNCLCYMVNSKTKYNEIERNILVGAIKESKGKVFILLEKDNIDHAKIVQEILIVGFQKEKNLYHVGQKVFYAFSYVNACEMEEIEF